MVRFKAAYVSGPYRPTAIGSVSTMAPVSGARRPRLFVPEHVEPDQVDVSIPEDAATDRQSLVMPSSGVEETLLDVIVKRVQGQGPPAHEVWLPPLDVPPTLDELLPPLAPTPDRGLTAVGHPGNGSLAVPLGVVDKPYEQRRDETCGRAETRASGCRSKGHLAAENNDVLLRQHFNRFLKLQLLRFQFRTYLRYGHFVFRSNGNIRIFRAVLD